MLLHHATVSRAAFASALFALSGAALGCSDQACIQKSSTATDTCPTQTQANALLAGGCNDVSSQQGSVESVDSDATENGDLCCYSVTFTLEVAPCAPSPRPAQDGGA